MKNSEIDLIQWQEATATGGCYECGATTFWCPGHPRQPVTIADLVDVFHVGKCAICGSIDEPCPQRIYGADSSDEQC